MEIVVLDIQVLNYLTLFAGKANRLGAAGFAFLLVAAISLVLTMDRTFNAIWRVRRTRPLAQRVLVYWAVLTLAKAGTLSVIGVYPQTFRSFPIGLAVNRNLTIQMGNCPHRKYIPHLVDLVQSGTIDPTQVLTQQQPLMSAVEAYKAFDTRRPGWVKVELTPATERV